MICLKWLGKYHKWHGKILIMKIYSITIMGIAIALTVIASRFLSFVIPLFGFQTIKISFGFIIIFLVSTQIHPICGGVVAAISDVVRSFLFPIGAYFPGFTLTSFLAGIMVGYLFKLFNRKNAERISFLACFGAVVISMAFISFLNTFWAQILFSVPFEVLIIPRLISTAIVVILISPVVFFLSKLLKKVGK